MRAIALLVLLSACRTEPVPANAIAPASCEGSVRRQRLARCLASARVLRKVNHLVRLKRIGRIRLAQRPRPPQNWPGHMVTTPKRANSLVRRHGTRDAIASRMHPNDSKRLSDKELIAQLHRACADANAITLRIIMLLIETEDRGLYLADAYSSMFDFCVRKLSMSEGAAWLRLAGARLVRRFPTLAPRLESGALHLTNLALLRHYLTDQNVEELADAVRGMSKRKVIEFLATREPVVPVPPEPARLRKLPKMKTANAVVPTVQRELELIADLQYRLGITLTRAEQDELLYVRDLMMHRNPSGDLKVVVLAGIRELREKLERQIHGATKRPPPEAPSVAKTESIPRHVRREVFARDGHRCAYTNENGERCPATARLELHHLVSPHHGGTNDPKNIQVRCRPHNLWHAEQDFGKEYVRGKIRSSQLKSRKARKARSANSARKAREPRIARG